MQVEGLVHLAHEQGSHAGQVAIAEYLLRSYSEDMSPKLKRFLEIVKQDSYEYMAGQFEMPTEDVALKVEKILDKVKQ